MKTVMTVRIEPELKERLSKLSQATAHTQSFLVSEAIKEYLDVQGWQVKAIEEGLRQASAGRLIPHEPE